MLDKVSAATETVAMPTDNKTRAKQIRALKVLGNGKLPTDNDLRGILKDCALHLAADDNDEAGALIGMVGKSLYNHKRATRIVLFAAALLTGCGT